MISFRPVLEAASLRAFDVCCRANASGCGDEECGDGPRIILPRRGVFLLHFSNQELVADANTALLMDVNDHYRVSHPVCGGDDCTLLIPSASILEEALGPAGLLGRNASQPIFSRKQLATNARTQFLSQALCTLGENFADWLLAQELFMEILDAIGQCGNSRSTNTKRNSQQKRCVERAKSFLACSPQENYSLEKIGRAAFSSPFHLARNFKAHTGMTLHQYSTQLRLALVLERLAAGEDNLARLAVDMGFATHSHLSERFRKVFGISPKDARATLTRAGVDKMRRILTAKFFTNL